MSPVLFTTPIRLFAATAAFAGLFLASLPALGHDDCQSEENPDGKHPATHPHCTGSGGSPCGDLNEIVGSDTINDELVGTDCPDSILGLGGADILEGRGGNDVLDGGDDGDFIYGGSGDDSLNAGSDSSVDRLYGDEGNDGFWGVGNGDFIDGGPDDPGIEATDHMNFNGFFAIRVNFTGADVSVATNPFPNSSDCNAAAYDMPADTILVLDDPVVTLNVINVEGIIGSPERDIAFGGNAEETFDTRRGDDCVNAGRGDDIIRSDRGYDVLIGGPGNDLLRGGDHGDQYHFFPDDFAAGEVDRIETFGDRGDCIQLNDGLTAETPVVGPVAGMGKRTADTVITLVGGGRIDVVDATVSGFGCP